MPWLTAGALVVAAASLAHAEGRPGDPGTGPSWASLSPGQREALAPLSRDWDSLDASRKQKWLEISDRYPGMSPAKRERVQQRMGEWARMTPEQRTQARANFQQSKRLPPEERQAQWQAYQSLSPETRQALAERAAPAPKAVRKADRLRNAPLDAQAPKTNLVDDAPTVGGGRLVAPTLIQGGPGATTSLINRPAAPPAHQQPGLPKISAGQDMVDRSTLLPKRGPQGAGARSEPGNKPGKKKSSRD